MAKSLLDLLKLEGSPRDIGYSHGEQGGERIRSFLEIIVKHGIESRFIWSTKSVDSLH